MLLRPRCDAQKRDLDFFVLQWSSWPSWMGSAGSDGCKCQCEPAVASRHLLSLSSDMRLIWKIPHGKGSESQPFSDKTPDLRDEQTQDLTPICLSRSIAGKPNCPIRFVRPGYCQTEATMPASKHPHTPKDLRNRHQEKTILIPAAGSSETQLYNLPRLIFVGSL